MKEEIKITICAPAGDSYADFVQVLRHNHTDVFFDDKQPHAPHIHVEYADSRAVVNIMDGDILAGELPANKAKLVRAWIEIHKDELIANWKLAVNGDELFKIDPLR